MATAQLRLTIRHCTIDQLCAELGKLQFAGYGAKRAYFTVTGTETLTVTVDKDLGTAATPPVAAKRVAAK